ncbi:MAG: TROVE domain-containing protein [Thermoanaerobaculia bacterium]
MANPALFKSLVGKLLPAATTVNEAGGKAYEPTPEQALAQYVVTGCLNGTFYASAEDQLANILDLAKGVDSELISKLAVYAREKAWMKDAPALLCALLSVRNPAALARVFPRVIDNGKMLRNFVQIIRSGAVGRKSLGSLPKRLVAEWIASKDDAALFRASVGQSPSLADVIKMVHPKPKDEARKALYGYLIGKEVVNGDLPQVVQAFEAYKAKQTGEVPDVPFEMVTALPLGKEEWTTIAKNASWQMTRMNLSTFARHGVFEGEGMAELVAKRLSSAKEVAKARALPYQLLVAYRSVSENVPSIVKDALQDAMELAIVNVPQIDGKVFICPDVSGSMRSPVTGYRRGSNSAVRCIDVAALTAAAIMRANPNAEVIPFERKAVNVKLNPRDSVMTNAEKLSAIGGGGTNCSAPLELLNSTRAKGDLVIFVSDNQSWADATQNRGTALMNEWSLFKSRNPKARLVCIDVQPYGKVQAAEGADVLNIGGFSDEVFRLLGEFATGGLGAGSWVSRIEAIDI